MALKRSGAAAGSLCVFRKLHRAMLAQPEKTVNAGLALLMVLLLLLTALAAGGFYYDLNDDVLIKDILSGVYTGQPEGRTMQILYPLGWLLSILYHVPKLPVFGLFLCLCQFSSAFVIAYRSLVFFEKKWIKALVLLAQFAFWAGACLEHFVFLQYTVTAGMLIAAAVFWLAVSGCDTAVQTGKVFWRENLPALILYWIGFCLRSEMGLLLLPLAGAVGFCRWFSGTQPLNRKNLTKYLGLFLALMAGLALCLGADSLAYASAEWREFGRYFDARTTIYDYQRDVVENYEENMEIYEELGVPQAQQVLLQNYNFGADDQIDADLLEALAQSAKERENGGLFRKDFRTALWELIFGHFLAKADFCLNAVMIGSGALLFVLGFCRGKRHCLWQVPLLTACVCVLWMFLLLRDRMPARISTPLYLCSAAAFGGLLLRQTADSSIRQKRAVAGSVLAVLAVCGIMAAPGRFADVRNQVQVRQEVNRVNEAVLSYCAQHPEYLFLEDVYSTVAFSEKIEVDRQKAFNYDLLGGWLVKSPLTDQKLQAFGLKSMGEAVCQKEQVRILAEAGSDLSWLEAFLKERGMDVKAVCEEAIADGAVNVYRIEAAVTDF